MAIEYDELPPLDTTPVALKDRCPGTTFNHLPPCNTRSFTSWARKTAPDVYTLPAWVAAWYLKRDRDKVHTKTGAYEHRFGLADPTDEMVAELGDEVLLTDPIEINPEHAEGWDVATSPLPRQRVVYEAIKASDMREFAAMLRERQGGALTSVSR